MYTIRPLHQEDDLHDLISLSRAFFEEYQCHNPDFFGIEDLEDEHIRDYFASFNQNPERQAFIALEGDRIVGYLTVSIRLREGFWTVQRVGEISGLMVDHNCRRFGIGRRLLERAKSFLEHQRVRYFTVYTAANNQGAIKFYRKNDLAVLYTTMLGQTKYVVERC